MATIMVEKGKHFIQRDRKQKELYIILQGKVNLLTKNDVIPLEVGPVIGLLSCGKQEHQCDYVAEEDTMLMSFPYKKREDMKKIFEAQPKYAHVFTMAANKQANIILQHNKRLRDLAMNLYNRTLQAVSDYKELCYQYEIPERQIARAEMIAPLAEQYILEDWKTDYYFAYAKKTVQGMEQFYGPDMDINMGAILIASEIMMKSVENMEATWDYLHYWRDALLDADKRDLFQCYFDLEARAARISTDVSGIQKKMEALMQFIHASGLFEPELVQKRFAEYEEYDFTTITEEDLIDLNRKDEETSEEAVVDTELTVEDEVSEEPAAQEEQGEDCLAHILAFAECGTTQAEQIRRNITAYRELKDIFSTEDDVRKLRKALSKSFYEVYKAAIKRAFSGAQVTPIMMMFFEFGFMDVTLAGEENANLLYELTNQLYQCNSENVHTMYYWLKSIYDGEREPSKNEFDMDYTAYLVDMKKNGRITEQQKKEYETDTWKKVEYEIDNMLMGSSRAVYGKISTFVPMLCEHDVINTVNSMLVTAQRIEEAIQYVTDVDFSVFYRDVVFSDPEHDVTREFFKKQVLPDIILMPNAGTNAMMWQETSGKARDTKARFLFPILTVSNVEELMVETIARFRWEICRKELGARWNDIREPSLTSEYCDYLQYYKKNHELTSEGKEKLKNALWKAKNNYREVFVKDYQIWIKYEAKGSFRMNRVSRGILFRYCPFVKDIRVKLEENPMYQELIHKHRVLNQKKQRRVMIFEDKYLKAGGQLTDEMMVNRGFYEM